LNDELKSPFVWLPRTPFGALVAYFIKRIFASEDEQSDDEMSLGLGVVIALLASPGAFASLFLLDKYSTLLQWLRGQRHFDFYRASAADEYFFIVLSMTITGLVMLMRWNRLFPDRRDFANLASLPIPIHHIFLANFAALAGLAFVFAIDVNLVSCFIFPAFVTGSDGRWNAFAKVAAGHITAVFSATLFSFFGLFALVGLLTLLLPRRLLRPVSVVVRILLAVALMVEFFSNLFLQLFSGRLPAYAASYLKLLPSFWFLGIYESVVGIAKPTMEEMARWALIAMASSVVVMVVSYALCYRRHFLRLAESFDNLAGNTHGAWFKMPEWLSRILFRSPFEEACILFALRVMTRSERHAMFLGGFLGVGLVIVARAAEDDRNQIPLLLAFFLISGLRLAFDIPAVATANWAFRFSANDISPSPNSVARRLMMLLVLPWQLLPPGSFFVIPLNLGLTVLGMDLVLLTFQRIPFTYTVQADSRKMVIRFILALAGLVFLVPFLVWLEHWAIAQWWRYTIVAAAMVIAWLDLRRRRKANEIEQNRISFEERAPSEFESLKLA
jgi:hypothetical protein